MNVHLYNIHLLIYIDDSDLPMTDITPTDSVTGTSLRPPPSPSRRESADEVADLPRYHFKKLPINQVSDADSAIGLVN